MRPRLRIFNGEDTSEFHEDRVCMSLAEFADLLTDVIRSRRTWFSDFADDEITISADLYEVMAAYSRLRTGA